MGPFNFAVEGMSDEGIARSILRYCGLPPGSSFGKSGKAALLKKLVGYNEAAKFNPWFVLVDMDSDASSIEEAGMKWLPNPSGFMCFAIAVRAMESWLMADVEKCAEFLGVSRTKIPSSPDEVNNPKELLISLAQSSRKKVIREGLVPRINSGAKVGPTYASDISEFANSAWRPNVAAKSSPSLRECLDRVCRLREMLQS